MTRSADAAGERDDGRPRDRTRLIAAVVRRAIVIGVDEYGDAGKRLSASVSDALKFKDWALADEGSGVPESNLRLLLSRRADDPAPAGEVPEADQGQHRHRDQRRGGGRRAGGRAVQRNAL